MVQEVEVDELADQLGEGASVIDVREHGPEGGHAGAWVAADRAVVTGNRAT